MSKIKIKNFGPIKEGVLSNDGWMNIPKITIFIGNQGSGKSSIAKVLSTLKWIEKALIQNKIKENDFNSGNKFVKKYCAYQNVENYFNDNTMISYQGEAYHFHYENQVFTIAKKENPVHYLLPKIMYVPAERNFLSVIDRPNQIKGLPKPLYTFLEEFENAKQSIQQENLPIGDIKFEYQKLNNISFLKGKGYKIRLSEASSGLQSFIPLYIVSKYLATNNGNDDDSGKNSLSLQQELQLKESIHAIVSNQNLSDTARDLALKELTNKFQRLCFINIVEEPEQNLYPSSQRIILNNLLDFTNQNTGNELVITTHSPYIINYLTLSIQGKELFEKIKGDVFLTKNISQVVPIASLISGSDVAIYQLKDNGSINLLDTYEGIPSDNNFLNTFLAEGNELFDELLAIEEEI